MLAIGWLCSFPIALVGQGVDEHLNFEAAGEGQHLPDLLRAGNALQMPVPPTAPLLSEVAVMALRRLKSTASFGLCHPSLEILVKQLNLLWGLLVRLYRCSYELLALAIGEEVALVFDALVPEEPVANSKDAKNCSTSLLLRRVGGDVV